MFDLELSRQWTLDFRKMKRPERSGVTACLLCYFALWFWGEQLIPHDFGGDEFSLTCWLMPWECPKVEPETVAELQRHFKIIYLSPVGHGKKPCTCHEDYRYRGPGWETHPEWIYHGRSNAELDCETVRSDGHPRYWSELWAPMWIDSATEARMHCEGGT